MGIYLNSSENIHGVEDFKFERVGCDGGSLSFVATRTKNEFGVPSGQHQIVLFFDKAEHASRVKNSLFPAEGVDRSDLRSITAAARAVARKAEAELRELAHMAARVATVTEIDGVAQQELISDVFHDLEGDTFGKWLPSGDDNG